MSRNLRTAVFMHGLESGPGGSKHRWLESYLGGGVTATADRHNTSCDTSPPPSKPLLSDSDRGHTIDCPDMQVSLWRPDKFNGFGVQLALNLLSGWPTTLCSRAMQSSLDRCLAAQARALDSFRPAPSGAAGNPSVSIAVSPALVVASSWGGAIATLALATGLWSGPTVLLAPAYSKALRFAGGPATVDRAPERIFAAIRNRLTDEQRSRIVIIHGTADTVVPFEDSEEFADAAGVELIAVAGGDHRLNDFVLDNNGSGRPGLLQVTIDRVLL